MALSEQLTIFDTITRRQSNSVDGGFRVEERYRPPLFSDIPLVITTVVILSFGILMLYSTSGALSQEQFGESLYYMKRQLSAALLGLIGIYVLSRIKLSFIKKISLFFFPISIVLLLLPLIPGIQQVAGGAARWVNLGGFRFQPGELVKVIFVIFMAGYFTRREDQLPQFFHGIVKPIMLVGVIGVLFLLQPDFGSTALLLLVTLTMALCAGVKIRHLLLSGVLCGMGLIALIFASPYRMRRLLSFLEPTADASGQGYQLIQSLIAVGSGELTGVGLGASQQKLFFLPAAHTDFIFAVIAEELGFLGALFVILLFTLLLWRGLRIACRISSDSFGFLLGIGMTTLLVAPAFLNLGVVLGLLPTKGLALPFISYGGTNVLVSLLVVGILLALARESVEGYEIRSRGKR